MHPNLIAVSHMKRACPSCKINSHVSVEENSSINPIYVCGGCGNVWNYDNILFKEVSRGKVGRVLERVLEPSGRKNKPTPEEIKIQEEPTPEKMSPPPGWEKV